MIINFAVALGSLSSNKIRRIMGNKGSLLFMLVPLTLGFAFVGGTIQNIVLASAVLLIMFYVRGIAHPILKKQINDLAVSSERATVLSLRSLLIRILFFMVGPLLGYCTDKLSLEYALYLCAIIVFVPTVVFLWALLCGTRP